MVKPPRTMQPEQVDKKVLDTGRKSGNSFQQDSFHNYMARKIEIQRKQFGVVLPPPPLTPQKHDEAAASTTVTTTTYTTRVDSEKPSKKSVSFSPSTKPASVPVATKKRKSKTMSSMDSILKRLRRRHGKSKRRRRITDEDGCELGECSTELFTTDAKENVVQGTSNMAQPEQQAMSCDHHESPLPSSLSSEVHVNEELQAVPLNPLRSRPDLFFYGVVIKVNGLTDPDNETLKRMVQKHGGDYETYETTRVTHLIAEHLSTAKSDMYKKQKAPRPVCLPSWIVDSIKEGRLLPHAQYILEATRHDPQQAGISSFFGPKKGQQQQQQQQHGSNEPQHFGGPRKLQFDSYLRDGDEDSRQAAGRSSLGGKAEICDDGSSLPENYVTEESEEAVVHHTEYNNNEPTVACEGIAMSEFEVDHESLQERHRAAGFEDELPSADHETISRVPGNAIAGRPRLSREGTSLEDKIVCKSPQIEGTNSKVSPQKANDGQLHVQYVHDIIAPEHSSTRGSDEPNQTLYKSSEDGSAAVGKPTGRIAKQFDDKYIDGKLRTVGTDPKFLESYFNSSRLSFIGSYKQRIAPQTMSSPTKRHKSSANQRRFVFHVDMDCFFASVVLRNFPEHRDKPVVISHHGQRNQSDGTDTEVKAGSISKSSTSECATCNYKAREYGIKKGMFLGRAMQLCPDLVILCYDFDGYEEVAEQVLEILWRIASEYHGAVEAVSCDEAYVELYLEDDDGSGEKRAGELAELIRKEVFETTQCTASIGVATNKFLAKLGTDRVKPDASFVVKDHRELLDGLRLRDLPGIGYRSAPKLEAEGLTAVRDIWDLGHQGEGTLRRILGPGLGKKIYSFCQGGDDRQVKPVERKTIGAECNYGVRFDGPYGIDHMINGLAKEVQKRMEGVDVCGRRVTLKLKQRKAGAKQPPKFLGHGSCHNHSKSMETSGSLSTRDAAVISSIGMTLYSELGVPLEDVRGLGLIVSKLDSGQAQAVETAPMNRITNWLKKSKQNEEKKEETLLTLIGGSAKVATGDEKPTATEERSGEAASEGDPVVPVNAAVESSPPQFFDAVEDSDGGIDIESHYHSDPILVATRDDTSSVDSPIPDEEPEREFSPSMTQIELPPLSQLHMSQVDALPPHMRRQILSRIETSEKDKSSSSTLQRTEASHVREHNDDPLKEGTEESHDATGTSSNRVHERNTRLPSSLNTSPENDHSSRFRQTNLKRLMRLAAIKSGNENSDLSLTQLETLPLEIQLQVANDDCRPVGDLSPRRKLFGSRPATSKVNSSKQPHRDHRKEPPSSEGAKLTSTAHEDLGKQLNNHATSEENFQAIRHEENHDDDESIEEVVDYNEDGDGHEGEEEAEEKITLVSMPREDPRAFYKENVAPLKVFLDENNPENSDAVQTVIDFFRQCIKENQIREIVILLRSIRNRNDNKWSNQDIIDQLVRATDDLHFETYGSRLDVNWLRGRS